MTAVCFVCGKEIPEVKPCLYNARGEYTCDECCQKCYVSEPFPCRQHDERFDEGPQKPYRPKG